MNSDTNQQQWITSPVSRPIDQKLAKVQMEHEWASRGGEWGAKRKQKRYRRGWMEGGWLKRWGGIREQEREEQREWGMRKEGGGRKEEGGKGRHKGMGECKKSVSTGRVSSKRNKLYRFASWQCDQLFFKFF
jgi:hypothetical protein